jgi:Flp pilus assembly protein TadD
VTGKAPAGGFDFQSRLIAFVSVHILAERPLSWTQFEEGDVPSAVAAETGGSGDDLRVNFSHDRMTYECQAKRGLSASVRLDDVTDDFASGLPQNPKDRGILLVDPTSASTITEQLREGLDRWREGIRPEPEGTLARVIGRLRAKKAEAVAERLYVREVDIEQDASSMAQLAHLRLEGVLEDPSQATAAWGVLVTDGLRLCRVGGRRDLAGLRALLGQANIRLGPSGQSFSAQLARTNENFEALRASLISANLATPPVTASDSFTTQLDSAKKLLLERRAEAALDLLNLVEGTAVAAADSTRLRLHNLKAAALLRLNRTGKARDELVKALGIDPTDKTALANLAHTELLEGNTPAALETADKLLTLDRLSVPAWVVVLQARESSEVPSELRDAPEILSTLAFLSLRSGRYEQAITYARRALERGYQPDRALLLVQSLFGQAFESDPPDLYRSDLEEAHNLTSRVVEELSRTQEPALLERALIARGQIARLLGQEDDAQADFAQAHTVAPASPDAAYMLALSYLQRGRPDGALFVIESAAGLHSHPLVLTLKARALVDLKRPSEAEAALAAASAANTGPAAVLDVTLMIVELAIDAGFTDFAQAQLTSLRKEAGWVWHLFQARLSIQRSEDEAARASFEAAIKEAGPKEQPKAQAEYAEYLRRSGHPDRAAEILTSAGAGQRPSLRPLLARALLEAGQYSAAAGLLEKVQADTPILPPWALRTGAQIALVSDDLTRATQFLEALRVQRPRDAEVGMRLADVFLRMRQPERAVAVLDDLRTGNPLTPRELIQLAELYIRAEKPEHALPLAYQALRLAPDAADVQLAYINIFLRREEEQHGLEVSQVEPNTHVTLQLDDGETIAYFIVAEDEPNRKALEVSPNDPIAIELIGKKRGDSITLRPGTPTKRVATISEVKSHFVHAFQDILLHFPERHPDNTHLHAFKMPENPTAADFDVITQFATSRKEQANKALAFYSEHGAPLGAVATIGHTSLPTIYWTLVADLKRILAVEFSDGYERARDAIANAEIIVVTRSALITLSQLDLLPALSNHGAQLVIPRSLLDELDDERRELLERSQHGLLTIESTEQGPVPHDVPATAYRAELERFDRMRGWVDTFCSPQPRPLASLSPDEAERREAFGHSSYDSVFLVRERTAQLIADDLGLRRLLLDQPQGPGFSTYALLGALLVKQTITPIEHDAYVAHLMLLNHETIVVTPRVCRMALERLDFNPQRQVLRFLNDLRSNQIEIVQVLSFCVALLREIATAPRGRSHLPALTLTLADVAVADRPIDRVLRLLTAGIQHAFALLPEERDTVLGCLERYAQAKLRRG